MGHRGRNRWPPHRGQGAGREDESPGSQYLLQLSPPIAATKYCPCLKGSVTPNITGFQHMSPRGTSTSQTPTMTNKYLRENQYSLDQETVFCHLRQNNLWKCVFTNELNSKFWKVGWWYKPEWKGNCCQVWWHKFDPQDPQNGRKNLTPVGGYLYTMWRWVAVMGVIRSWTANS